MRQPLKELRPGELLARVAYPAQVCAGEPIEVKVAPSDETIDIYVQGRPGTHQFMQLYGQPGPRQVQVYAHKPSGQSQFIELAIEVVDCDATWPRLQVALDTEHDRMVDFVVANAHEIGEGRWYHWTFGDGTELDTDVPAVRHTYAVGDIDWHSPDTTFQASVEPIGVCPSTVARHSVVIRPLHTFNEAHGLVQLPVEYDITAHAGDYTIYNVEDEAVTLTRAAMDLQPCDRSEDVRHEPSTDPAISIEAHGTYAGHLALDALADDVCATELHLEGTLKNSGARVEVPIYLEVRDNPSRTHEVRDPAVQHMLDQARTAGLFHGDRVNVGDLQEYAREGRVDFARPTPLVESDLPAPGSVVPLRGDFVCHPENAHETPDPGAVALLGPDIECRASGSYESLDAYVANGHSGNIALSAGCGTVGALLRAVTPRQRFSHTGIFTDDLDTLRNSTASEEWLKAHQDSYRGIYADNLRHARPGILSQTVGQAYYGMTWHDDMESGGHSYELNSFNMDPVRCDGDTGFARPTLIFPTRARDDSDAAQTLATHQAMLARRVAFVVDGMQGHYRFFGYTFGNIGLDRAYDWSAPPHLLGDDGRNHATVCSSTIWTAAKSLADSTALHPGVVWPNLILERNTEEDSPDLPLPIGITGREEEGLYFYTQDERLAGAELLFANIYNGVGLTFLHLVGDARENYANQMVNCFASDECGQEARNNDNWRHLGPGTTVSPDDLLLWDAPWGKNEPLALRPAQFRQVYTWQQKLGQGELLVTVVDSEGSEASPVVGADTHVAGQFGRTDAEGKTLFLSVPAGEAEVSAMIWTGVEPARHLLTGSTTTRVSPGARAEATIVLGQRDPGPNVINEPQQMIVNYAIAATDDEWIISNEQGNISDTFVAWLASGTDSLRHVTHDIEPFCVGDEVVVKIEFLFDLLDGNQIETTARVKFYEGASCDTNDLEDYQEQTQTLALDEGGHLIFDLENSGVGGGDTAHVDIQLLNQLAP